MPFHRVLIDSEYALIAVSAAIGLVRYKKMKTELRFIVYFVLLGAFTEIFNVFYRSYIFKNNLPIGHFYIPFSILIFGFMYKRLLVGFLNKYIFNLVIFSFALFAVINPVFFQSLWEFPNVLGAVGALMLIVFSILYFGRMMKEGKINKLTDSALVWVNSLVLFYYTGNFFFYILFNLSLEDSIEFAQLTTRLYLILNLLLYLSIIFILLKFGKSRK